MFRMMSFSPSNFTRYVSQTESIPDETSNTNDWSPGSPSTINDLPSLLTFSAVPAADLPENNILKPTATISSVASEEIESIPYLHHGPGPIQRPNKLNHSTASATNSKNSLQSPGTADVLDHINRFIYADSEGRTSTNASNNVNSNAVASPLINDLTPSNMPWSFSSTEWSSKLESSWALPTLQSPNISLSSPMENPFTMMPQAARVDSSLWSSATIGIGSPRFVSPSTRTQRASAWNDFFASTVPSATTNEIPKMNTDPWAKYMTAPDPSSTDVTSLNEHDRRTNHSLWPLPSLSTDSVVPTTTRLPQGASSQQIWWTGLSSDENNNTNHRTDNNSNTRDQSRWDFAR